MKKLLILLVPFMMAATSPFSYTIQTGHPRLFINADCTVDDTWDNSTTFSSGDNISHNNQIFKARKTVPANNEPTGHDQYWEVCIDFQDIRDRTSSTYPQHEDWYDRVLNLAHQEDDCSGWTFNYGSEWINRYGMSAAANAIAYLMTGTSVYKTNAVACANYIEDNTIGGTTFRSSYTTLMALAYDWLTDAEGMTGAHGSCTNLSSAQNSTFQGALVRIGEQYGRRDKKTTYCKETVKMYGGAIVAALAVEGDVSGSDWTSMTTTTGWDMGSQLNGTIDCINKMDDGGEMMAWGFYSGEYLAPKFILLSAVVTAMTDFDLTADEGAGTELFNSIYLIPEFDDPSFVSGGDGHVDFVQGRSVNGMGTAKSVNAFLTNDDRMRWFARELERQVGRASFAGNSTYFDGHFIYPLIFVDHQEALQEAPSITNSGTAIQSFGNTVMRSGWDYDNDVMARLYHPTPVDHGMMGDGSIQVWRDDDNLIIERGYYQSPTTADAKCYARRTISSSGITVWDSGGSETKSLSCTNNCGCQRYPDVRNVGHFPNRVGDVNTGDYASVVSKRFKDASLYDYAYVDFSDAYLNDQATSVTRSMTMLKESASSNENEAYIVLYDRVTAQSSGDRKRLLFQYKGSAGESSDVITITEGGSKAFITPLLPTSPNWTRVTSQLVNSYSGQSGKTYSVDDYGDGRYELMYSSESQYERFFNIIQVGATSVSRTTVTLQEESNFDCGIIEDSSNPWVVCFANTEARMGPSTQTLTLNAASVELNANAYKYMVADMKADTYRINGLGGEKYATADSDGTIYFTGTATAAGATITITETTETVDVPAAVDDVTATASTTECKAMDITLTHPDADTTKDDAQDCVRIACMYGTSNITSEATWASASTYYGGFDINSSGDEVSFTGSSLPADATTYYWGCRCRNSVNWGPVDGSPSGNSADTPASDSEACDPETPPDKPATVTDLEITDGVSCGGEVGVSFTVPSGTVDYCDVAVDTSEINDNDGHTNADKVVTFDDVVAGDPYSDTIDGLTVDTVYYGAVRCGNVTGEGDVDAGVGEISRTFCHDGCDFNSALSDSRFVSNAPAENYGARVYLSAGLNSGGNTRRSILKFDFISSLQGLGVTSSDEITTATINMTFYGEDSDVNENVSLYRVLKDWGEGDKDGDAAATGESTWNSAKHNQQVWSSAGANATADAGTAGNWDSSYDRHSSADATTTIDTASGSYDWTVTTAVKSMFTLSKNYGFLIVNDDEGSNSSNKAFHAKESDGAEAVLTIVANVAGEGGGDTGTSSSVCGDPGSAPSDITDLSAVMGPGDGEAVINFSAPFDDDSEEGGTAEYYIVRYSTTGAITSGNWSSAATYSQSWNPLSPTATTAKTMTGLPADTKIWLSIKSYDEDDNASGVSNSPSVWVGDCVRKRCGDTSIKSFDGG